jgi:hypothetical protein
MSIPEGCKMAASHPGHPVLSSVELLKLSADIGQAIERCGASVDLTSAVTLATDMYFHLRRYIEQVAAQAQPAAHLTIPGALEWDGDNGTHGADGESGAHSESSAAIATLKGLGYTHHGGQLWKPPVGQKPDFDLIDSLRAEVESLHASAETVNEVMVRMRADLAEQTARVRTAAGFDLNAMLVTIKGLEGQLANTEQSRRSFFDLSQDLEKRLGKVTAFVQSLCDAAGSQPSVATGYLRDILDALSVSAEPATDHSVDATEKAKQKTCIECDQPYCHGVCVERGDQDYDRDQAAKGGDDE